MRPESNTNEASTGFSCFMCGECCSRYQVRVTLSEARRISETLGVEWEEFIQRYADSRWPGEKSLLPRHKNGACVFLKRAFGEKIAMCSIHSFKPDSCIQWTAGPYRRECQAGLKRCWGLTVDEGGMIIGEPEKIDRFNKFVSSPGTPLPEPQE